MDRFEPVSRWISLGLAVALVCAPASRARAQSEALKNQSNEIVGEGYGTPSGGQTPVDATTLGKKAKALALQAGKSSGAKLNETAVPAADSTPKETWAQKAQAETKDCYSTLDTKAWRERPLTAKFDDLFDSVTLGAFGALIGADAGLLVGGLGFPIGGVLGGLVGVAAGSPKGYCTIVNYASEAKAHFIDGK